MKQMYSLTQAQDPPARPQGLEDLLHMLAAQQVDSQTDGDAEPSEQQQADAAAYTQSMCARLHASNTVQIVLSGTRFPRDIHGFWFTWHHFALLPGSP